MSSSPSAAVPATNKLLGILPPSEYNHLASHLELVRLDEGQILLGNGKISHVYFPISGIVTKVVKMNSGEQMEAGMIGNEGMIPLCLFLELTATPFHAVVQNSGQALRISAKDFKAKIKSVPSLGISLMRFAAAFTAQASLSAACNQLHPLLSRYCRWLLMTHDRMDANQFVLTQQTAAAMLGVRRMTITAAARQLHDKGLIDYRRGKLSVLDRPGLERTVCECYGRIKMTYDTLLTRP